MHGKLNREFGMTILLLHMSDGQKPVLLRRKRYDIAKEVEACSSICRI